MCENPPMCENITLTIEEDQEEYPIISLMKAYDNLYELKYKYYDIYKYVYNVKKLQRDLKLRYIDYDLKRNYWKPIKSQCLISMLHKLREKRENKWNKNNLGISMEHAFRVWDKKTTYLCVDIRDYFGRPKL